MSSMSWYLQLVIMFSGYLLIESDDKSLNWLYNKLRFGGSSRFMELPVFALLFLLLRKNELKFWLLSVPKGNRSLMHLKQNHGSVEVGNQESLIDYI